MDDDVTIIILLIGEASGVFAGFCPSWFTVSSPFFHEQEAKGGNVKRIRWGEVAASLIVIATGAAVWKRTGKTLPFFASILICAVFVAGYEYMIAHPATEDAGTTVNAPVVVSDLRIGQAPMGGGDTAELPTTFRTMAGEESPGYTAGTQVAYR